ncbi:hypothetical protein HRbin17_02316 [bacterium HR17]|uniref:Uncharacterized protein n=1 Tax=Candidatus Fervidibacter japonicus TaxID=2035412 RepID=A0A2H5XF40_9BACT|nr:hypothetical protein HRbin17_02316 [bacterium HR17]
MFKGGKLRPLQVSDDARRGAQGKGHSRHTEAVQGRDLKVQAQQPLRLRERVKVKGRDGRRFANFFQAGDKIFVVCQLLGQQDFSGLQPRQFMAQLLRLQLRRSKFTR